jgi:hypothetical protein
MAPSGALWNTAGSIPDSERPARLLRRALALPVLDFFFRLDLDLADASVSGSSSRLRRELRRAEVLFLADDVLFLADDVLFLADDVLFLADDVLFLADDVLGVPSVLAGGLDSLSPLGTTLPLGPRALGAALAALLFLFVVEGDDLFQLILVEIALLEEQGAERDLLALGLGQLLLERQTLVDLLLRDHPGPKGDLAQLDVPLGDQGSAPEATAAPSNVGSYQKLWPVRRLAQGIAVA